MQPRPHKHDHFMRRHAFSVISAIYNLQQGVYLIPDESKLAKRLLASEQDATMCRNVFLMLRTQAGYGLH
jgi:hypothetical protein